MFQTSYAVGRTFFALRPPVRLFQPSPSNVVLFPQLTPGSDELEIPPRETPRVSFIPPSKSDVFFLLSLRTTGPPFFCSQFDGDSFFPGAILFTPVPPSPGRGPSIESLLPLLFQWARNEPAPPGPPPRRQLYYPLMIPVRRSSPSPTPAHPPTVTHPMSNREFSVFLTSSSKIRLPYESRLFLFQRTFTVAFNCSPRDPQFSQPGAHFFLFRKHLSPLSLVLKRCGLGRSTDPVGPCFLFLPDSSPDPLFFFPLPVFVSCLSYSPLLLQIPFSTSRWHHISQLLRR